VEMRECLQPLGFLFSFRLCQDMPFVLAMSSRRTSSSWPPN
jgi:hypothetical protein